MSAEKTCRGGPGDVRIRRLINIAGATTGVSRRLTWSTCQWTCWGLTRCCCSWPLPPYLNVTNIICSLATSSSLISSSAPRRRKSTTKTTSDITTTSTRCCDDVCSIIHPFIRSFIRSFVRSFVRSFIHSFIYSFLPSSVYLFQLTNIHINIDTLWLDLYQKFYSITHSFFH